MQWLRKEKTESKETEFIQFVLTSAKSECEMLVCVRRRERKLHSWKKRKCEERSSFTD
jgi:hypothetical protein